MQDEILRKLLIAKGLIMRIELEATYTGIAQHEPGDETLLSHPAQKRCNVCGEYYYLEVQYSEACKGKP